MKFSPASWLQRFETLSMRERLLVLVAVPALFYALFDFTVFTPKLAQRKLLTQQLEVQGKELAELRKLASEMTKARPVDRLSKARAERDALQSQVDEAQGFIDRATERAPLARVIRSMVAAEPGLTLTNLRTLPVDVFYRPGAVTQGKVDPQQSTTPTLYRHGVEATVKGSYAALLPYLQGLQKHSDRLFWTQVSLEVAKYPDATLKMTIYTLSDQQEAPLV